MRAADSRPARHPRTTRAPPTGLLRARALLTAVRSRRPHHPTSEGRVLGPPRPMPRHLLGQTEREARWDSSARTAPAQGGAQRAAGQDGPLRRSADIRPQRGGGPSEPSGASARGAGWRPSPSWTTAASDGARPARATVSASSRQHAAGQGHDRARGHAAPPCRHRSDDACSLGASAAAAPSSLPGSRDVDPWHGWSPSKQGRPDDHARGGKRRAKDRPRRRGR